MVESVRQNEFYSIQDRCKSHIAVLDWLWLEHESLNSILIEKLLSLRAEVRIGSCKLWRRRRREYCWLLGGVSGRSKWLFLHRMLLNNLSSACSHYIGKRKSRRITVSKRSRPSKEGFETTTVCSTREPPPRRDGIRKLVDDRSLENSS